VALFTFTYKQQVLTKLRIGLLDMYGMFQCQQ